MQEKKKELDDEKLEKVSGGSHVEPEDIHNYVGRDMIFSYGFFGIRGPYPVHINSVDGTIVNMTFTNPDKAPLRTKLLQQGWTELGNNTWVWDYDDGSSTWLE